MFKDAPASEPDWDEESPGEARGSTSASRRAGHHRLARSGARGAGDRASGGAGREDRAPQQAGREGSRTRPEGGRGREKSSEKPRNGWLRRHPLLAVVGLVALLLAVAAGYLYWDHTSHFESTDDAFIAARQFAIAPKVAGYVTAVPVTDNQHVDKGGMVAQIDQRDYHVALAQAEAQVGGGEAGIHNIDTQIATQDAQIAAAQAQVSQAQANLELTKVTWGRDKPLVNQGWATAQQGTVDVQNLKAQQAAVDSAQATLKVAQRQIDTLRAQRASAEATLAQAQAQRDQAQLNLSYTTVIADQPGRVVNLTGAVGQYAQAGTNLTMFVPDEIWVVANYKETQLDRMRPGQPVDIEIDAYPERDFHGHRRQRPARLGPGLLAAAARKRHRQLCQDRPARAGQDHPRQSAGRCGAWPWHVGRPDRAGRSVALPL